MGRQKRVQSSQVERERVICENCRYQYQFLYDAKPSRKSSKRGHSPVRDRDLASLKNQYADLNTCYQPCPHCGFAQPWMVRAKRWARVQDYGYMGLYAGIFLSLLSLALMLYAALSSPEGTVLALFSGFGKAYVAVTAGYLLFGLAYVPFVLRFWDPNRHVDKRCYEATRAVEIDQEQQKQSIAAYQRAAQLASRLGRKQMVSPEPRLSARGKALVFASCALAVLAFLSPSLFPQLVVRLNDSGLMMLPFYIGMVFLLITTVGGSWKILYKMML